MDIFLFQGPKILLPIFQLVRMDHETTKREFQLTRTWIPGSHNKNLFGNLICQKLIKLYGAKGVNSFVEIPNCIEWKWAIKLKWTTIFNIVSVEIEPTIQRVQVTLRTRRILHLYFHARLTARKKNTKLMQYTIPEIIWFNSISISFLFIFFLWKQSSCCNFVTIFSDDFLIIVIFVRDLITIETR